MCHRSCDGPGRALSELRPMERHRSPRSRPRWPPTTYTTTLGDGGHQIDLLVLHFNGNQLDPEDRNDVIGAVEQINADSPD